MRSQAVDPPVAGPARPGTVGRPWLARLRSPSLAIGLVVSGLIGGLALLAPAVAPYDPVRVNTNEVLVPPGAGHWLGTDDIGRDLLSRILYGAQTSLVLGLAVVLASTLVGAAIALVGGYRGGRLDMVLMRIMDGFLAFPGLILALAMVSFLGASNLTIVLSIAVVATPGIARITRSQVLVERRRDFVEAARVVGASDARILLHHILPNVAALITVQASLNLAFAILTEASLSFLGVGVPPPAPTWGTMLRAGYSYLQQAPWVAISPGAAIFLTVLGFNLLGDGLRGALSPRRR
jgi:ABC-type dipeptide/oligopeptide/nickel transport system permease subunit